MNNFSSSGTSKNSISNFFQINFLGFHVVASNHEEISIDVANNNITNVGLTLMKPR